MEAIAVDASSAPYVIEASSAPYVVDASSVLYVANTSSARGSGAPLAPVYVSTWESLPLLCIKDTPTAYFGRPSLKHHFSIWPWPPPIQSSSESQATRKKGFWARYRKE